MGDNEMALLSIEWAYRAKECTPARSYQLMHRRALNDVDCLHLIRPMVNSTFLLGLWITVLK